MGVVDFGLFSDYAAHIAKSVKKVYYHNPSWKRAFPSSRDTAIGSGLAPNMVVAREFWDIKKECDWFLFPDVYLGDWQEELKAQGLAVCGAGKSEWLERDREKLLQWEEKEGMDVPDAELVTGLDELEKALEPDDFIKIDDYRADLETTRAYSYDTMKEWLDVERAYYGRRQNSQNFLKIKKIEGKEIGYDGWTLNGGYPEVAMWGIEIKGVGYAGQAATYNSMPAAVRSTNAHLAKVFQAEKTKTMFSTEVRVDKRRRAYLTDPCMREGNPPNQSQQCLFSNMPEVFYGLANGILVNGKPTAKFVVQLQMWSDFAKHNETTVSFPESIRPFVKLRNAAKIGGKYCVLPSTGDDDNPTLGAIVGTGSTLWEASDRCRKNAEQVKALQLEIDFGALDKMAEEISEFKDYGISF